MTYAEQIVIVHVNGQKKVLEHDEYFPQSDNLYRFFLHGKFTIFADFTQLTLHRSQAEVVKEQRETTQKYLDSNPGPKGTALYQGMLAACDEIERIRAAL